MELLIDTNVILEMVLQRKNYNTVIELFRIAIHSWDKPYITASSITDLFYIIRKETRNTEQTYIVMEDILTLVSILLVEEFDIWEAYLQKWNDFEDCVQYMTGKNHFMECIVTFNKKDYSKSLLPVLTPEEYIQKKSSTSISEFD